MLPVIALVGRPNVGKSTLFNCLTKTRDAIVADQPGVTRDRIYGTGRLGERHYIVVDTGGLSGDERGIDGEMAHQTLQAIEEADSVLFMVDARDGLTPGDHAIAKRLRQTGKPVFLVVNKTDGLDAEMAKSDFYALGLGECYPIAAAHGRGVSALIEQVIPADQITGEAQAIEEDAGIKIAVVGRPNVGKSTLVNRLLGEERVVVFDLPGTTRDSISIPFEHHGKRYTLIDTAGMRRKRSVDEGVERFSVIKTLQAIESAHVVILVIDARESVTDQDASLLGLVLHAGRAVIIAVNKWDGMTPEEKDKLRSDLELRLDFIDFAKFHFISALHGSGVGNLYESIDRAFASANIDMPTPALTRILEDALQAHQPPLVKGRRIKLRYAHQGGKNPPLIVIHGNQAEAVPDAYKRYLSNVYRKALRIEGTPIKLEFRSGKNPFAGRRNILTERQVRKKRRLMKHTGK